MGRVSREAKDELSVKGLRVRGNLPAKAWCDPAVPDDAGIAIRDSLAKELLWACFETLRSHGLPSKRLMTLSEEVVRVRQRPSVSGHLLKEVTSLARLISEWTENESYVDDAGRPKPLPIKGKSSSFEELAKRHFPGQSVQKVIQLAVRLKAIERIGTKSVAHLGTCVLLTGNRLLLLGHAIRSIRWFLDTNDYNGRNKQSGAWPERQAVAEISEEKFGEFLSFMRDPIINLVEMGNRWLLAQALSAPAKEGDRKILVGVHAYTFKGRR